MPEHTPDSFFLNMKEIEQLANMAVISHV
jgi:hypothetical protein